MFNDLQPVYVQFDKNKKKYEGVVICDIGERTNGVLGKMYVVRFVVDREVYEKVLFVNNLQSRDVGGVHDDKLSHKASRDWLSTYAQPKSFRFRYTYNIKAKAYKARLALKELSLDDGDIEESS